ncbi:sortase family protein [Beutenbergia cavernae DSM 12333]|uniref:Sortase family protein n=1 Tax=Beutenbergia cavernae (strain ATCC BAA-8 / DSM 12333 / CCUG 43141 / JCM 11478 / NBRC 16432 / NCIMB 13614 / HKI 0122) TaxID=471853 RepID=C5BUR5_BEUC1|nr:class E sortase [Beutenbergia cavernae]ACQ78289.1 sortase family protein [Beutenbergia cavernae DSM 12333]
MATPEIDSWDAVVGTDDRARPARRARQDPARRRRRPVKQSFGSRLVGFVGELLITVGVLLGLFVVWQLWWTDVEAIREQGHLIAELEETFTPSPEQAGEVRTDEPPVMTAPPLGETFAELWVPRWDADDPYRRTIAEGVDRATVLDVIGIGHYPDTAMPGDVGNFATAGHRQTFGRPFFAVDQLQTGDSLIVSTAEAWYVYTVTETAIVAPTQVSVIAPNPSDPSAEPTERLITLTTCHPLFSTRERFIVHGVLDHWVPRESGRPAELIAAEEGTG